MDINKLNAPLHIRCPKCKAELEYSPRRVKDRLDNIKIAVASLQKQLPTITDKKARAQKVKEMEQLVFQMKLLKEDNNMMSTLLKEETERIFKQMIREFLGDGEYMRILKAAEDQARDENVFHTYELAIQKYSNIPDNIG